VGRDAVDALARHSRASAGTRAHGGGCALRGDRRAGRRRRPRGAGRAPAAALRPRRRGERARRAAHRAGRRPADRRGSRRRGVARRPRHHCRRRHDPHHLPVVAGPRAAECGGSERWPGPSADCAGRVERTAKGCVVRGAWPTPGC
jgi:hypothetical protein